MGNDGGSIPDRRDLVRNKPKAEKADKANQTRARWFFCALSKRRLQEPIVACPLGKLYNKDSVIEFLLDHSAYGDGDDICGHIRSLKDVKTLKLTPNPAPQVEESVSAATERADFICPLSSKEMNGVQPFIYISTCGCVFSQAGLKNMVRVKASSDELDLCPQCATKFHPVTDVILLNPSKEDEERMHVAMDAKRLLEPKKTKKRKKDKLDSEVEPSAKKAKVSPSPAPSTNPAIAAASRTVLSSLATEEAKRKAGMTDAIKSIYGHGKSQKETFMTWGTFNRYA